MIVDGKAVANELYAELKEQRKNFGPVTLGVIVAGVNSVL